MRVTSTILFLGGMSFAFLSYFIQMRQRVQAESTDQAHLLADEAKEPQISQIEGREMANYDY